MVMGARLDMDETDPSTDSSLTSYGLANLVFRKKPNDTKKSCLRYKLQAMYVWENM
jgi:hypothetical protein